MMTSPWECGTTISGRTPCGYCQKRNRRIDGWEHCAAGTCLSFPARCTHLVGLLGCRASRGSRRGRRQRRPCAPLRGPIRVRREVHPWKQAPKRPPKRPRPAIWPRGLHRPAHRGEVLPSEGGDPPGRVPHVEAEGDEAGAGACSCSRGEEQLVRGSQGCHDSLVGGSI